MLVTFSVVCYDPDEQKWGVGVASRFLSVGSVVPWARAGVGCIATQSYSNYTYGPEGLSLLRENDAKKTIGILTSRDEMREKRQVAAVDGRGSSFAFTGSQCHDYAGHILGRNYSVQGNILAGPSVLEAMAREMERKGKLEDRIMAALMAAQAQGGDSRGRQSASILIASSKEHFEEGSDIYMDIRVEDSPDPLPELKRIMRIWMATFFEKDFVQISDNEEELNAAMDRDGVSTVEELATKHNLEFNLKDGKIGKYTLEAVTQGA